jgi:hypothetical protein
VAKDKDEIPSFEHLNFDGPGPADEPTIEFNFEEPPTEPAAAASSEPAAAPSEPDVAPPDLPTEDYGPLDAAPEGETFEMPEMPETPETLGEGAPESLGGEPAPEYFGDFGAEPPATDAATDAAGLGEGDQGGIEFGASGDAGEELHTEEEHEPEQSEEQLADAVAARKLNTAAMALMAVGGVGVLAGFVLAFLKGVAMWLAVLIGIHYAAPPALLLALGLCLFFAVKNTGGTTTLDSIKQGRVYEAVLAVAFFTLWIAGYCLLGELSTYGYDLKATKVDRGSPTAVAYAGPPSTTAAD